MTDVRPPIVPDGFFAPGSLGGARSGSPRRRPADEQARSARPKAERPAPDRTRAKPRSTSRARQDTSRRAAPVAAPTRSTSSRRSGHRTAPANGRGGYPPTGRGPGRGRRGDGGSSAPRKVRNRYLIIGGFVSLFFLIAVAKLTDLQVLSPTRYRDAGSQQRMTKVSLQAARGAILDRNGRDLAVSVPKSSVVADPSQVSDVRAEAALLAPILDMPARRLEGLLRTKSRFVYLDRLVSDATASKVTALADRGKLDGIDLINEYKRVRPAGHEAQSVIGATDIDGTGISGLEHQYDSLMVGRPGSISYEQSSMGPIAGGRRQTTPSVAGGDLVLSLDANLQYTAEQLVAAQVTQTGSKGGIAIISRPSTGEILSMVNMVADPKTGRVTPSTNNQAVTTVFEPGSVNKVITVAQALAEGVVTPATVLPHPSVLNLGGADFSEAESMPGQLSVTEILTVSSNIGTIELAQKIGARKVDAAIRRFGFGSKTSLDFPNESAGLLLPLDRWSGSSIGSIPIGQGISVTALQMLQAYNVIANDGVAVPPKLVTATIDAQGRRHATPTRGSHRVISSEVATAMRGMLANVVKSGTGEKAAVPGYQVAGKTGTARKPLDKHFPGNGYMDPDGHYHYVSTFVGMLPAGDPQLSIIVVLDDPDPAKSYYASDTAAPLFGQLARAAVRQLHLPPSSAPDPTVGLPEVSPSLLDSTNQEPAVGPGAAPPTTVVTP